MVPYSSLILFVEDMFGHSGELDEFQGVAFDFHVVVFYEVSEVYAGAEDGAEELCDLCLGVV